MGLTLGQAAEQVGKSKPALSKAIARGRLSAVKKEDGSFDIDPAELDRWVKNVARKQPRKPVNLTEGNTELTIENRELKAQLEAAGKEAATLRTYIEDLRSDKDFLQGELKKATLLLTAAREETEARKLTRSFWQRLTGRKRA